MKIMILNPPRRDKIVMVKEGRCMQRKGAWGYVMSPVTMVTMATMLRDDGHETVVIDAGVDVNSFEQLLERTRKFQPEMVVINTATTTIEDDMYTSIFLKDNFRKDLVTVLFGIHVSVLYKDVLLSGNKIDYCVIGEPEMTIKDLASSLATRKDISQVKGLATLAPGSEEPHLTGDRGYIKNLDDLPIPDWSFVNTDNYRLPFSNEKFLLVNTNRGCPYQCTFCNAYVYYGRVPRRRSVEHIMREIRSNVEKFGVRNFMIWTEEFILDREYVKSVCRAIIESGLKISWVCNSRVDAVDEEVLTLIRKAGCWNIAYGIESGVQEILDKIKKQTTLEQIRRAVALAKKCDLKVTGHVIIGFPEDTAETMAITEKFINSLDLDFVQYYCAMPYPGTGLFDEARKNGWINSKDWTMWEHNFSVLDYPHMKADEIMRTRNRFFRKYYFNPKTVIRTVRNNIKRPKDVITFIKNVKDFLQWM